jgi:hypothetical protein
MKIMNKKFSHTITSGATAGYPVFGTVTRLTDTELRTSSDSEIKTLISHFNHLISVHSLEEVMQGILSECVTPGI